MGWWKRMRNKLHPKKTARPVRYAGHIDPFQDPHSASSSATAPPVTRRTSTSPFRLRGRMGGRGGSGREVLGLNNDKALMMEEGRFSTGSGLRPSMGDSMFEPMSFELPRRPHMGGGDERG